MFPLPQLHRVSVVLTPTQGQGLGKEGRGLAEPIAVKLRPKNLGLAADGFKEAGHKVAAAAAQEEEREQRRQQRGGSAGDDQAELDDELEAARQQLAEPQGPRWRKGAAKPRRVYKTVDELRAEQGSAAAPVPMKVLDMTGPQARVVSSVEDALAQGRAAAAASVEAEAAGVSRVLPELQYNVRLLADLAQGAVLNTDRRLRCVRMGGKKE
jgi:tuftelin-interacting protein 11